MKKIFFALLGLALFLSYSAKAQTSDPAERKIGKFYGTVIAVDSETKIATLLVNNGGHVIEIDASGLERKFGLLEKNVEYYIIYDASALDCTGCRVKTQGRAVAYHITPEQASRNIAEIIKNNVPKRAK